MFGIATFSSKVLMAATQLGQYSLIQWAIFIVAIAAVVAVVIVILKRFNIVIPEFIVNILWIVLAAVVGILAINFIAGLL